MIGGDLTDLGQICQIREGQLTWARDGMTQVGYEAGAGLVV